MLLNHIGKVFTRHSHDAKKIVQDASNITKLVAVDKFHQKAIRVALLSADTRTGEYLSFLIKQNPLVSHLFVLGEKGYGIATDLDHMDTRTMITGCSENDVEKTVRRAEVVILLGVDKCRDEELTSQQKFQQEYERVIKLARICTMYSPKAIFLVCVSPVSYMVPLVSAVFKKTHWYHPGRIIGFVGLHQISLNTLLASHNNLDPSGVNVPVVGGPDLDCLVPLFSRATPIGTSPHEAEILTKKFKGIPESEKVTQEVRTLHFGDRSLAEAFSINRTLTTLALGLLGDSTTNMAGFIRSNIMYTCKYLTSTIQVAHGGVRHNYGIPLLTKMELQLMEKALLTVHEREKYALQALESVNEKKLALMAG